MTEHYRVWRIANFPAQPTYYDVSTPRDGAIKINELAKKDLRNKNVDSNAFGLEVYDNGEWSEWYDENGDEISVLADTLWES